MDDRSRRSYQRRLQSDGGVEEVGRSTSKKQEIRELVQREVGELVKAAVEVEAVDEVEAVVEVEATDEQRRSESRSREVRELGREP